MLKEIWERLQVAQAVVGGAMSWFFGEINGLFYGLVAMCVIEFVVGAIRCCVYDKSLSSAFLFKKATEKLMIFILVGIANVVDKTILAGVEVLRDTVIFFYLSGEAVSVLEHAGLMGLPIPKKLRTILKNLENEDEQEAAKEE